MKNCIVYSVNNNRQAIYLFLYSVSSLKFHHNDIEIYLLVDTDFSQKYQNFISYIFQDINIIRIDHNSFLDSDINFLNQKKLSINNHYRFIILKNDVVKDYDNVLYLDIDTEIYSNISGIFDIKPDEYQFWGNVLESSKNDIKKSRFIVNRIQSDIENKNIERLNFNLNTYKGYCNAGVLLIKQNKMNNIIDSNELFNRFHYYLRYNFHYPNQDVINYIFNSQEYNRYQFQLPTNYNFFKWTNECQRIDDKDIIIRHFPGDKRKMLRSIKKNNFDVTNGLIQDILKI